MSRLPLAWAWWAYAGAWLLAPLWVSSGFALGLLSQIGIAIIVCLSYNILLGQGGMLSFGHAVYSGAGAFLAIHTMRLLADGWPFPVVLVPLAAGLGAMMLALVLGWISTRKAGMPFAMITLGIGELVWAGALMFPDVFGGEAGISSDRAAVHALGPWTLGPALHLYWLVAGYTVVCTALMYGFTRTPLGRLLNAVRDNPLRVGFLGFNPHMVRYLAFVIAGGFAGVSGGLAALQQEVVGPDMLGSQRAWFYLLFTVLGGTAYFAGPIAGAVLMVLAFAVFSEWTRAWLLYLGLGFGAVVLLAPGGVAGLFAGDTLRRTALQLRSRPTMAVLLLLSGCITAVACVAMVEMAYQLQLRSVIGDGVHFLAWQLHAASIVHWSVAAAIAAAGIAALTYLLHARRATPMAGSLMGPAP
ncbi:MAG: branched-chain amino acid ABC transporter permease [Burkholderiaceae bacterium]